VVDQKQATERTLTEIQADIDRAQRQIEDSLAGLIGELHPKAVVHRTVEDAKAFAGDQLSSAKSQVKDQYGWRLGRLALIAGAAVGVVTFVLAVRARGRRSSAS
jgi:anti-sigma-K factor RskA